MQQNLCDACNNPYHFLADAAPSGESSPLYVTAGQNITYSCRVSYNSSTMLKMTWTYAGTGRMVQPSDDGVKVGSRLLATDQHHNTLIQHETVLTYTVPKDSFLILPFMCSVYAPGPVDLDQPFTQLQSRVHTWNSSIIVVSCECITDKQSLSHYTRIVTAAWVVICSQHA
jgi:hypothetical protein